MDTGKVIKVPRQSHFPVGSGGGFEKEEVKNRDYSSNRTVWRLNRTSRIAPRFLPEATEEMRKSS